MNIMILILMIYWIPSFLYLLVWSISIRKKHKLTNLDKVGETLVYTITLFFGLFIVFLITPKRLKNGK